MSNRNLGAREIEILLHLLRHAGDGGPVRLLKPAREAAIILGRRGLINIWFRQSLHNARLEGPFHSLTIDGRAKANAILQWRMDHPRPGITDLENRSPAYPPHDLNQEHHHAHS